MAALIRVGGAQSPCPPRYGSPWMRKGGRSSVATRPNVLRFALAAVVMAGAWGREWKVTGGLGMLIFQE
jgi:hypothetical protein